MGSQSHLQAQKESNQALDQKRKDTEELLNEKNSTFATIRQKIIEKEASLTDSQGQLSIKTSECEAIAESMRLLEEKLFSIITGLEETEASLKLEIDQLKEELAKTKQDNREIQTKLN